jgi:toxin-antitoxin system PIN domain toxin
MTQHSFMRLLTTASVLAPYGSRPLTNEEAWAAYGAFIADDRVVLQAEEPVGLERQWRAFSLGASASPKLWMDAYLAAFALTGGFRMVTTDVAYRQFQGLDMLLLAS